MRRIRYILPVLALLCILSPAVFGAEVDCDSYYCFQISDFSEKENLTGVCITGLPKSSVGTVMLGSRVIRSGDILTAEQATELTFCPLRTEVDTQAQVTYLPIFSGRVEPATTMTISIRGKEDKKPVAEDSTLETYKNIPNSGKLKARDPEGMTLTYTLVRNPKRGEVVFGEDGSFTYTPKKNKVGVDSFTYTATDPAGKVSREATVTVRILKPSEKGTYKDTVGMDCRFAAEWMRNTGLFEGEKIGKSQCFYPEKPVSRGEFLSMVIHTLEISTEEEKLEAIPSDTPAWLKPYLAAAMRSGLTASLPQSESGSFMADEPITGAEAAVILQNALDLQGWQETAALEQDDTVPAWAQTALSAMSVNGICLEGSEVLTRGEAAQVLYRVSCIKDSAPGMAVIRMLKN